MTAGQNLTWLSMGTETQMWYGAVAYVTATPKKPLWVELSCGAGPVHAVLEPGWPLLLECQLGASPDEEATEVTWLRDGVELQEGPALRLLSNGSLLVAPPTCGCQGAPLWAPGGRYSKAKDPRLDTDQPCGQPVPGESVPCAAGPRGPGGGGGRSGAV
ncbi:hypothetical protein AALO_G00268730 [Alosa alosa]|uniref:Ig-like domain-containing protein n=1 Tax=Alosa alosa TaxID=278164 RepID=A0AAV6FMT4_9TELE|nr:hypothetical protein AALO_G00268730 [Alosa alosa]